MATMAVALMAVVMVAAAVTANAMAAVTVIFTAMAVVRCQRQRRQQQWRQGEIQQSTKKGCLSERDDDVEGGCALRTVKSVSCDSGCANNQSRIAVH
jgi:hypothetical protein